MTYNSLGDPFSAETSLNHKTDCDCPICTTQHNSSLSAKPQTESQMREAIERAAFEPVHAEQHSSSKIITDIGSAESDGTLESTESITDRAIESAMVRAIFGNNDMSRRAFLGALGGGTLSAILGTLFTNGCSEGRIQRRNG